MKPQLVLHLHKALQLKRNENLTNFPHTYAMFIKYDGNYVYFDYDNGVVSELHSRQQRQLASLIGHAKQLLSHLLVPFKKTRFIFEVTIPDEPDFHTANGLINRSVGDCKLNFNKVRYHLHDVVNLQSDLNFEQRYLDNFDKLITVPHLSLVPLLPIAFTSSIEEMFQLGQRYISLGHEGIVGKNLNSTYEFGKRTQNMIKVKIEEPVPVSVLGWRFTIGEKGNEGCLLNVRVNSTGAIQEVAVNDHIDRLYLSNSHDLSKLKETIIVDCMSILPSGKLREPRLSKPLNIQLNLNKP